MCERNLSMSLSVNPQGPVATPPVVQGPATPVEAKPAEGTKPSFRGAEPVTNPAAPAPTAPAAPAAPAQAGAKLNIIG